MICIHNLVITIADLTHISLRWMIFIKSKWFISDLNRKNIIKVLIIRNYKIFCFIKHRYCLHIQRHPLILNCWQNCLLSTMGKKFIHCITQKTNYWYIVSTGKFMTFEWNTFSNLKCFRCEYKITCSRINEKKCKPLERSSRAYIKSVHWKERSNLSR